MALAEARSAGNSGEVPVGAVLVAADGTVIARARNQTIERSDPTAHAEILAIRQGGRALGNYRLIDTALYVTVEPCLMCMGAIIHARVARLVFGAQDPRWGGAGSLYDFAGDHRLNHHPVVISGILSEACAKLMRDFFRSKRKPPLLSNL
jgi:tRNA(adenine34) deaminase